MAVGDEAAVPVLPEAGLVPAVAAGLLPRVSADEARRLIAADLRRWGGADLLHPTTDLLAQACADLALTGVHLGLARDALTLLTECRDWLDHAADLELAGAHPDEPLDALRRVCGALRATSARLATRP
ncbi:hypothetical protein [Kitasatospora sp. NPDC059327]|uniref:hypothetical protein n=1 Tax=Kitasatospora sp. NPDC059327 TaxID=3346803 RepID=UPI00367CA28D